MPRLEITEVVLAHGNIVSNKFIPHKSPKEKCLKKNIYLQKKIIDDGIII